MGDNQPPNTEQDIPSHETFLHLAAWNQPPLDPDEEELFNDSQPKTQPTKRKLPEWFGTSKGIDSSVTTGKKSKVGAKKGLFG